MIALRLLATLLTKLWILEAMNIRIFVIFLLILTTQAYGQGKITLGPDSSIINDDERTHILTICVFQDKGGAKPSIIADGGLPKTPLGDSGCFTLVKRDAQTSQTAANLRLTVVKATARGIQLRSPEELDTKKFDYAVVIKPGCIAPENQISNEWQGVELYVDSKDVETDQDFLKNRLPESKIELKQGEKTGTFSFSANYKRYFEDEFSGYNENGDYSKDHKFDIYQDAMIQAQIDADISFRPSQKGEFLNRLQGEIGGYVSGVLADSLTQIGFSSKLQCDQQFESIDQTVGINAWMWINQDWLNNVGHALYLSAEEKLPYQGLPLLILGYDFVGHLETDRANIREYDGNHRLHGRFYWALPILRDIDLHTFTPIDQRLDLDLVVDIGGIYDAENSKFAPEMKLSLDLGLSKVRDPAKQPSISFAFVEGRVAPTFEHFNAFLAGVKIPF